MKFRKAKKAIKQVKAQVANIALGYKSNVTYGDLYNAIWSAEQQCRRFTDSKSPKLVLLAHNSLEEMQEVRELAYQQVF